MKNPLLFLLSFSVTIAALILLSGCAVESPKFYVPIGSTGYSAYGYAGVGLAQIDPDSPSLGK